MSHLSALTLTNFRSYQSQRLQDLQTGLVVIYGANGAGKTNILEAVSLLTPGRGLRGAKNEAMLNCAYPQESWGVAGALNHDFGETRLGTGLDAKTGKRLVRIDGQMMRGQNALAEHLSCVWLTPQMDRLFLDSASHRRKFLDRLIFAFDAGHAGRVTRYENALSQRSKILRAASEKGIQPDHAWLSGLEAQMAESACAIAAARLHFINRLQAACDQIQQEGSEFPHAQLSVNGQLEEQLQQQSALDVEDSFKTALLESRQRDGLTGGAKTGPHKSDLIVTYAAKSMLAEHCSTGEQKSLLIGIILAHALLIHAERGAPPILLLDEVAAHLDEDRRAALYRRLIDLGGQVWLTGTDRNLFEAIEGKAQFFEVLDSKIALRA